MGIGARTSDAAVMTEVAWSACVGSVVVIAGLIRWLGGDRRIVRLAPIAYAAPLAAFGTEHFTLTGGVASLVPSWLPWPELWVYAIGAGFIVAALAIATGVLARLAASVVAGTFLVFVLTMDLPTWLDDPHDRFAAALALRELAFAAGALALAARTGWLALVARSCIAAAVAMYGIEQLLHADFVPGVPLNRPTPGHPLWTYLAGAIYVAASPLLVVGPYRRLAALVAGATVLVIVAAVYAPMLVAESASLPSFNFFTDTLMFGGTLLVLAQPLEDEEVRVHA
jgi:uncharacterized membrane protein YphA (DoxX/SURF4 family)